MKDKKVKVKKNKEGLVLYFDLHNHTTEQSGGLVFIDCELFVAPDNETFEIVKVGFKVNFYLDLLLLKNEFNTFTGLYFSHGFVGNYKKISKNQNDRRLLVEEGQIDGVDLNGKFKHIKEI